MLGERDSYPRPGVKSWFSRILWLFTHQTTKAPHENLLAFICKEGGNERVLIDRRIGNPNRNVVNNIVKRNLCIFSGKSQTTKFTGKHPGPCETQLCEDSVPVGLESWKLSPPVPGSLSVQQQVLKPKGNDRKKQKNQAGFP